MRELGVGYSAEVDAIDESDWYQLLERFADANIYQTWAYGLVRSGRQNISHLILKYKDQVVAMAQCRIERLPGLGAGIAYVMWGPIWRPTGVRSDAEVFRQAIRALRHEYAGRRGLLVRIYPTLFEEESAEFLMILEEEGFGKAGAKGQARTIIMDLTPSIDELRKRLRPHWHRELKVAEKQNVEIYDAGDDDSFQQFIGIYKEMVARKKFREPNDIQEFREIQRRLPVEFKMKVLLCRSTEGLCAGMIASRIGATAVYLFGATSTLGMKTRGSYLLQWTFLQWLKEQEVPQYDLNGINPEANPGTYKFKSDLAGNNGKDVRFIGRFESCDNMMSFACVSIGEKLRAIGRSLVKA